MKGSSVNVDALMVTEPPPITIPGNIRPLLAPDHRLDLRKSGLTDATINAAGIAAIPAGDIDKAIGYNIPEVISAYRIPFGNGYERIKVFYRGDAKPAPGKKFRKYHQKAGTGNRLYIPPTLDPAVLSSPNKVIYITEGEKKALKAAQEGFTCIAITGLWNWKRKNTDELITDFAKVHLRNRKVILVPDSDWQAPNKNLVQAVERFARALQIAGAEVHFLNLPVEGDEKVGLDDFLIKHGNEKFSLLQPEPFPVESFCIVVRDGLKFYETEKLPVLDSQGKKTGTYVEQYKRPVKIADAFEILAFVRNENSCNWGKLLRFIDKEGIIHTWFMPAELMCRDGEAVRKELLNRGLYIHPLPKYRTAFNIYLQTTEPIKREFALCTDRTGWHKNVFVLPERNIPESYIIYQGNNKSVISSKGSLEDWIEKVSMYCIGNSRLVFGVSLAFAATILEICGKSNGGFHMRGESTTGKSTVANVSASVWGSPDFKKGWDGTTNGHQANAFERNDLPTILDEIAEADARTIGKTVYTYVNGQGRMRAEITGDAKNTKKWRTLVLSNGEKSLADIMRAEGIQMKAGQELRLCDIPADTGCYGVFEHLHEHAGGAKFSEYLQEETKKYYGNAGIAFIEAVINSRDEIPGLVKGMEERFNKSLPPKSNGSVIRVANHFALIAAAGVMATKFGLTGWSESEAVKASLTCMNDWINARGGVASYEIQEALGQIRRFFENHGVSKFTDWEFPEAIIHNRAGFRKKTNNATTDTSFEYFVLPETFKQEICAGLSIPYVTKLLIDRGVLVRSGDSATVNVRLPGLGQKRCYHFTSKVLEVE